MEKKLFLHYYNQGFSDTKISTLMSIERHKIGEIRKSLNLPRTRPAARYYLKIKELANDGFSDLYISKELGISGSQVNKIRKDYLKLKTNFAQTIYKTSLDRRKGYMLRNIKFSAKKRNLDFDLDYKDLELPKYCPILGFELKYGYDPNSLLNASVDRIDNSKGYIKGNIMIMSRLANLMKNQANLDQLQIFIDNFQLILNHHKSHGALGSITDIFPEIEFLEN